MTANLGGGLYEIFIKNRKFNLLYSFCPFLTFIERIQTPIYILFNLYILFILYFCIFYIKFESKKVKNRTYSSSCRCLADLFRFQLLHRCLVKLARRVCGYRFGPSRILTHTFFAIFQCRFFKSFICFLKGHITKPLYHEFSFVFQFQQDLQINFLPLFIIFD